MKEHSKLSVSFAFVHSLRLLNVVLRKLQQLQTGSPQHEPSPPCGLTQLKEWAEGQWLDQGGFPFLSHYPYLLLKFH